MTNQIQSPNPNIESLRLNLTFDTSHYESAPTLLSYLSGAIIALASLE